MLYRFISLLAVIFIKFVCGNESDATCRGDSRISVDIRCMREGAKLFFNCSWNISDNGMKADFPVQQALHWYGGEMRKVTDKSDICNYWPANQTCEENTSSTCTGNTSNSCTNCRENIRNTSNIYGSTVGITVNKNGTCTVCEKEFHPYYIVKPGKIQQFYSSAVTSRSFEIHWRHPDRENHQYKYKISILSPYNEPQPKEEIFESQKLDVSKIIENNIRPYRNYTVSIKSIISYHSEEGGYWSEPTINIVTTDEDVPASHPIVTSGGFTLNAAENNVVVYWKPIPEPDKNGLLTEIRIKYTTDGGYSQNETLSAGEVAAELSGIKQGENYTIYIDAKTSKGYNETLEPKPIRIHVKSEKMEGLMPVPADFVVRYNKTSGSVIFSWSLVPGASNYTIYWCHGSSATSCKEKQNPIDWHTVCCDDDFCEISLKEIGNAEEFSFAISAEGENGISSGMHFTDCNYDATKLLEAPEDVYFAPDNQQDPDSLTLRWHFECLSGGAYVESYRFYYQKTGSENITIVTVSPADEFLTLQDLEPLQKYRVSVESVSKWQRSNIKDVGTKEVTKGDFVVSSVAIEIVVGVVVLVIILLGTSYVIWCFWRKVKKKKGPDILLPENVQLNESLEKENDDADIVFHKDNGSVTFLPKGKNNPQEKLGPGQALLDGYDYPSTNGDSALGDSLNTNDLNCPGSVDLDSRGYVDVDNDDERGHGKKAACQQNHTADEKSAIKKQENQRVQKYDIPKVLNQLENPPFSSAVRNFEMPKVNNAGYVAPPADEGAMSGGVIFNSADILQCILDRESKAKNNKDHSLRTQLLLDDRVTLMLDTGCCGLDTLANSPSDAVCAPNKACENEESLQPKSDEFSIDQVSKTSENTSEPMADKKAESLEKATEESFPMAGENPLGPTRTDGYVSQDEMMYNQLKHL